MHQTYYPFRVYTCPEYLSIAQALLPIAAYPDCLSPPSSLFVHSHPSLVTYPSNFSASSKASLFLGMPNSVPFFILNWFLSLYDIVPFQVYPSSSKSFQVPDFSVFQDYRTLTCRGSVDIEN